VNRLKFILNKIGLETNKFSNFDFDVHFYLVAILFLVLDLEVMFLFPWAVSLNSIGLKGFLGMAIFLLILTVGFFYEWRLGALEWASQQSNPKKKNNSKRLV
jgi:NADH-quinone oxidoreductase subunit A